MSLDPNHARALQTAIGSLAIVESHMRHLTDYCVIEPALVGHVTSIITALKVTQERYQ